MQKDKFTAAVEALEHALSFEGKIGKDEFYFSGIAKSFEVAFEYGWKYLKVAVEESGLGAPSPRDAIKQAAKISLLDDPELWLECLRVRNVAVHDYLGISREAYLKLIHAYFRSAKKLLNSQ